jgi:hypothetical protein
MTAGPIKRNCSTQAFEVGNFGIPNRDSSTYKEEGGYGLSLRVAVACKLCSQPLARVLQRPGMLTGRTLNEDAGPPPL